MREKRDVMANNNFPLPFNNGGNTNFNNLQMQNRFLPTAREAAINNIIWTPNEKAASEMQLPYNSAVILLDSNENCFYIKTTDNIGMPNIRIFDYVERAPHVDEKGIDLSQYVTKDEMMKILEEIKNEQSVQSAKPNDGPVYTITPKQQ